MINNKKNRIKEVIHSALIDALLCNKCKDNLKPKDIPLQKQSGSLTLTFI